MNAKKNALHLESVLVARVQDFDLGRPEAALGHDPGTLVFRSLEQFVVLSSSEYLLGQGRRIPGRVKQPVSFVCDPFPVGRYIGYYRQTPAGHCFEQ